MALIRKSFLFTFLLVLPLCFALNSGAQELVTNGNFETGNANGWTATNTDGPCGYYIYSGTQSPLDNEPVQAPPQGTYAASNDQFAPCQSAIYQDIAIPANQEVTCSLIYYYMAFDEIDVGPGLEIDSGPNQQGRIDIMTSNSGVFDTDSGVLKNLYQTQATDPLTQGYTTLNFDLSEYAGSTVRLRIAQANNEGGIYFAVDAVTCTAGSLGGEEISTVPTLSEWSLIVMAGLLGIIGFLVVRRRKVSV